MLTLLSELLQHIDVTFNIKLDIPQLESINMTLGDIAQKLVDVEAAVAHLADEVQAIRDMIPPQPELQAIAARLDALKTNIENVVPDM